MHPALLLIPAAALVLGPRIWVGKILKDFNQKDEAFDKTAGEFARELLDGYELNNVAVEITDIGDHYDPKKRAVRLSRDKYYRRSLTALTTAAHEVAHAVQHASGFPPFEWRIKLVKVARVTGDLGSVLLLAVPIAAVTTRRPLPPAIIGSAALSMIATGVAAQLAALPTELDASFKRALPMLQDGYLDDEQLKHSRKILVACSLTYVASSLAGALNFWPWLGRSPAFLTPMDTRAISQQSDNRGSRQVNSKTKSIDRGSRRSSLRGGAFEQSVRRLAKPAVRQWFKILQS